MEIVEIECRCKDCSFCEIHKGQLYCRVWEIGYNPFTVETNPNDFCSHGEKRSTEER